MDKIPELNEKNLALENEKKELILQKEDLEKKIAFLVEHFSNILKNNNIVSEKNYYAMEESSRNNGYNRGYDAIISLVDKLNKELYYYKTRVDYGLNQATKSFVDTDGIFAIISCCDWLKEELESFNDLTKGFFNNDSYFLKNSLEKKEVILNEIKNNIVEKKFN